jgi:hypothetical protein
MYYKFNICFDDYKHLIANCEPLRSVLNQELNIDCFSFNDLYYFLQEWNQIPNVQKLSGRSSKEVCEALSAHSCISQGFKEEDNPRVLHSVLHWKQKSIMMLLYEETTDFTTDKILHHFRLKWYYWNKDDELKAENAEDFEVDQDDVHEDCPKDSILNNFDNKN